MELDFRDVIAEKPYDEMGAEFREIFGRWVNETKLTNPNQLNQLAFGLFCMRLALAQKYHTFFATQVTANGTRELWKDRFSGLGTAPCYSFATPLLQRTQRFWHWCEEESDEESGDMKWKTEIAAPPELPVAVKPDQYMKSWTHKYHPRFTARTGGAFNCRRAAYGTDGDGHLFYLFIHPRNQWISQIRAEATTFWNIAWDANNDMYTRMSAIASFEWLWNWANPFMRSGALTSDALSLVMQKHMGVKMRTQFYHQDCEALLLTFDDYVEKRIKDMIYMWAPRFDMNITQQ